VFLLPDQSFKMVKTVLVAAVVMALVHAGAAVQCYHGVGDTTNSVECYGSCVKSTAIYDDDDEGTARSCSPITFQDDCHEASLVVQVEMCYCNSDYCNGATPAAVPRILALLAFTLLLRAIM